MNISSNLRTASPAFAAQFANQASPHAPPPSPAEQASPELREAFTQFVGETFYSQLLGAMRSTVQKPAYFHGGRGEEVFQGQLDQILAQDMTTATADRFAGPMFDLFMLGRPK
jgi:peptidoglycan hydrolase FlgJ